jgi:hypothetical protein
MSLAVLLEQVLRNPTPDTLWRLQPALLALDHPSAAGAREIAGQFFAYLNAVRSKAEARRFPVLATAFAATSTSLSIGEDLLALEKAKVLPMLLEGVRLTLDILSNYQFVRQWEPDFAAVHDAAVWNLYGAYWKLSEDHQADMDAEKRRELLDGLFSIVRDPEADSALRLALLVRLFAWGLIARMVPLIALEASIEA